MTKKEKEDAEIFAKENSIDREELLNAIQTQEEDFEIDNYRFIRKDAIDKIQESELADDIYILGCFNASFLSDFLPLDTEDIKDMQKAEMYDIIGKLAMENVAEIQQEYAKIDGYGHHFNHYDGNEEELINYYAFKLGA